MAEGLGAAASIVAVIQITAKVTSLGYDYIGGFTRAPNELRDFVDELSSLNKVFGILQRHADVNPQWTALQTLNDQDGPLRKCNLDLRRLQLKMDPGDGLRGMVNSLKWPFREKETLQEISRIERHKVLFMFALNSDQISLLKAIETYTLEIKTDLLETKVDILGINGGVVEIKGHVLETRAGVLETRRDVLKIREDVLKTRVGVQDTSIAVQSLQASAIALNLREQRGDSVRDAETRIKILNWIYPRAPDKQHIEIRSRRQKGTGKWLLLTPEVKRWIERHPKCRLLWGYGIPGAGKTFLSSVIIDFLQEQASTKNYGVAHIYFNYNEQGKQRAIEILASLIKQLALQVKVLAPEIRYLYTKCTGNGERPTFEELYTALLATHKSYTKTFFVYDALDECDQKNQRKELLPLFHRMRADGISMFLTSRQHPEDIRDSFKGEAKIGLSAKGEDIKRYIQQKIDDNPRAKRLVQQGKCEANIISELTECAKGMFLFVHFHIEYLCQQTTVRQILLELEKLKSSSTEDRPLDPTYDRVMEVLRAQPRNCVELALKVLAWLVKAERRLTFNELQMAVAIEPDRYELDELDLPDKATLLDVCAGLVMIDDNRNTVQLAHYTVQEYLLKNSIITDDAHSLLGVACITFLGFDAFAQRPSYYAQLMKYPFLAYSARYWEFHLEKCDETLSKLPLLRFLARPNNRLPYFITQSFGPNEIQEPQPALHIASSVGHYTVAKLLLESSKCLASGTFQPELLQLAGCHGYKEMVRLVQHEKHEISAVYQGSTALHSAACNGHTDIVQLLLDNGVDALVEGRNGTALDESTSGGHLEVVQLLLDRGANIFSVLKRFHNVRSAFLQAVSRGHEPVVRLLLDRGGVEVRNKGGGVALHIAVHQEAYGMVQLLLSRVNISALNSKGYTVLHRSVYNRNKDMVQLLLEGGAKPSIQDKSGQTALHTALSEGKGGRTCRGVEAIVWLLLDNEVDLSVQDTFGRTAIHIAVSERNESALRLLLDKGADPSVRDIFGRTALHLAMYSVGDGEDSELHRNEYKHKEVTRQRIEGMAQVLLDYGVDSSAQESSGQTALHIAVSEGDERLVNMLLEKGVDLSIQDKSGRTALHMAALGGYDIQEFKNFGRSKGLKDLETFEEYKEFMQHNHFCISKHFQRFGGIIRLLLDKGAGSSIQGAFGLTVVHEAALRGDKPTLQLLLDKGADLSLQDTAGQTVLHLAAILGEWSIIEFLVGKGADILAQDTFGRTVLHNAALHDNRYILQHLLDKGADPSVQDYSGQTALHIATCQGHQFTAELLVVNGSNFSIKDNCSLTTLHVAACGEETDIYQLPLD